VGYYKGKSFQYAGKVGTGYDDELLKDLHSRLEHLERKTSPFEEEIKESEAHWVTPKLVCEIGFTEWTQDGKLRHPRFLGLRTDKKPKTVTRESKG
jgi:ATP-dependent DNA ligase